MYATKELPKVNSSPPNQSRGANEWSHITGDVLVGGFEEIGGVRCYVATPSVDYPKDKVVLFLTDVYGIDLVNSQARLSCPSGLQVFTC